MVIDSADYYFTEFQTELPKEAAGTRIGMYAAWLTLRGLAGEGLNAFLDDLRARSMSCGEFIFEAVDGKLTEDDLNEEGQAFTRDYFEARFDKDYERIFEHEFGRSGHPVDDVCRIPDLWMNYDRLAQVLNRRWMEWKSAKDGTLPARPLSRAAVYASVLKALDPFFRSEGFTREPEGESQRMGELESWQTGSLFRASFSGGDHWLLVVVAERPGGHLGLNMILGTCLEEVAVRIRDHGLPQYYADESPDDDPLPLTSTLRLHQWLRHDETLWSETDDDNVVGIRFRNARDVASKLALLKQKVDGILRPLMHKVASVQGLYELRCTQPLTSSMLYTDPFNRYILSVAEAAGSVRLREICDELDVLGRDPYAPGMRVFWASLDAYVNQVRGRIFGR